MKRVITIDGGAATGKSTAMLRLSRMLGWRGVSTGHVYRAATVLALTEGIRPEEAATALSARLRAGGLEYDLAAQAYAIRLSSGVVVMLDTVRLTTPEVSAATPQYSRIAEVRAALLDFQRGLYAEWVGGGRAGLRDGDFSGRAVEGLAGGGSGRGGAASGAGTGRGFCAVLCGRPGAQPRGSEPAQSDDAGAGRVGDRHDAIDTG